MNFKFNHFSVEIYPTKEEYLETVKKFIEEHKDEYETFRQQQNGVMV